MTPNPSAIIYTGPRTRVLAYVGGAAPVAIGLFSLARRSNGYVSGGYYVLLGGLLLVVLGLIPSFVWPDTLEVTPDGIRWATGIRRKTRFSARWDDVADVGVYRPKPLLNVPFGSDAPSPWIGFRFKAGHLPRELVDQGAGVKYFGPWTWVIPGMWTASPTMIVNECMRHLRK